MTLYPKLTAALANSALIVVTEHRHFPLIVEIDGMEVDQEFAEIAETEEELGALEIYREYLEAVHFGDVQHQTYIKTPSSSRRRVTGVRG